MEQSVEQLTRTTSFAFFWNSQQSSDMLAICLKLMVSAAGCCSKVLHCKSFMRVTMIM